MRRLLLFCTGGVLYPLLEIAWRGWTHRAMGLAGGICLCLIDRTCDNARRPLWKQCALCAICITAVEFGFGVALNLIGHRKVWDYSHVPGNLLGQICLPFTILWFFLSIPAVGLCRLCRKLPFCHK
ncbi:MAG: hypothetical protein PUC32_01660 [Oscillospiraceae bacterium]|nr:hypothetical protein [Oscillospiraceae bacterium]